MERQEVESRLRVAIEERASYLVAQQRADLRLRIATRVKDEEMKKGILGDSMRIEEALDVCNEEIAELEKQLPAIREPVKVKTS